MLHYFSDILHRFTNWNHQDSTFFLYLPKWLSFSLPLPSSYFLILLPSVHPPYSLFLPIPLHRDQIIVVGEVETGNESRPSTSFDAEGEMGIESRPSTFDEEVGTGNESHQSIFFDAEEAKANVGYQNTAFDAEEVKASECHPNTSFDEVAAAKASAIPDCIPSFEEGEKASESHQNISFDEEVVKASGSHQNTSSSSPIDWRNYSRPSQYRCHCQTTKIYPSSNPYRNLTTQRRPMQPAELPKAWEHFGGTRASLQ